MNYDLVEIFISFLQLIVRELGDNWALLERCLTLVHHLSGINNKND